MRIHMSKALWLDIRDLWGFSSLLDYGSVILNAKCVNFTDKYTTVEGDFYLWTKSRIFFHDSLQNLNN